MRSNYPIINVLERKNFKSKVVTQLLYGETFKIINKKGKWLKIKNDLDNYKGYIQVKKFLPKEKNTHKIYSLKAELYSKPSIKYKVKKKVSFGSKINVTGKKGKYFKFDNLWVEKKHLKRTSFENKNIFTTINNVKTPNKKSETLLKKYLSTQLPTQLKSLIYSKGLSIL